MELKHLAIRELHKEEDKATIISDRGGIVSTQQSLALDIVSSLNNALARRSTLTHGSFNQEAPQSYPFIQAFERYAAGDQGVESFLQLADLGISQLASAMDAPTAHNAVGGYIIFAHYAQERFEYLLVALVRNRSAISFNEQLKPTEVNEVDLDKLHQAAKINITSYSRGKDSYLSFMGTKEKGDVTHYFSNAFGCTDVTPSKKSTGDLIKAAKDFCTQNGMYEQREKVVEDVVSYLSRQRAEKSTANLPDVEQIFDQHVPAEQAESLIGKFSKFANSENYKVSHEFQPHTHTLNAMTKLKTKADNWQLDFSKKSFGVVGSGCDVEFDEASQTITLRRLPSRVMEQLKRELQQEEE